MKTTIILARHGETDWNSQGKLQGKSNIPLNKEGEEQAKKLAKRLKEFPITKMYSSELTRAVNTAKTISNTLNLSIEIHKGLNERDYGEFEGMTWDEIRSIVSKDNEIIPNFFRLDPKKGESYRVFHKRIVKHFLEIAKKHPSQTILLVCHGAVINALLRHINNIKDEITQYRLKNTSVTILGILEEKITVELLGDAKHLE